jgi:hypothetical protein
MNGYPFTKRIHIIEIGAFIYSQVNWPVQDHGVVGRLIAGYYIRPIDQVVLE